MGLVTKDPRGKQMSLKKIKQLVEDFRKENIPECNGVTPLEESLPGQPVRLSAAPFGCLVFFSSFFTPANFPNSNSVRCSLTLLSNSSLLHRDAV